MKCVRSLRILHVKYDGASRPIAKTHPALRVSTNKIEKKSLAVRAQRMRSRRGDVEIRCQRGERESVSKFRNALAREGRRESVHRNFLPFPVRGAAAGPTIDPDAPVDAHSDSHSNLAAGVCKVRFGPDALAKNCSPKKRKKRRTIVILKGQDSKT